jgi:hypothetical protein
VESGSPWPGCCGRRTIGRVCGRIKEGELVHRECDSVESPSVSSGLALIGQHLPPRPDLALTALTAFDLWSMSAFPHSKATGQTIGASFSARGPTVAVEREDQLLERSELASRAVFGDQYVADGIDSLPLSLVYSPATPRWPPPGARAHPPRGTFWSALAMC